jgi:hypothetical protein
MLTAADVRASIERAGATHWQALVDHHEQAYPRPCPTPGAICHFEAERLNQLGWGDGKGPLFASRVRRVGDAVEIIHGFYHADSSVPEWTPPFTNYEPEPAGAT